MSNLQITEAERRKIIDAKAKLQDAGYDALDYAKHHPADALVLVASGALPVLIAWACVALG